MKLTTARIDHHLRGDLAPVYVVSGDEPLQLEETLDAIRAAARERGYTERVVMHADATFDWIRLREQADTLSLFGDRKLIDLRLPTPRPDKEGQAALSAYAARPGTDQILLVSMPRVDGRTLRTGWYRALEGTGAEVRIWEIDAPRLPEWVGERARRAGLALAPEAARLVAERSEGHLLACAQEIEKLRLIHGAGPVDAEQVLAAVADSARFNAFDLVESMLAGDARRSVRIVDALREEGHELLQVLGALGWSVRTVHAIAAERARGQGLDAVLAQGRYANWKRRRGALARALERHPPHAWAAVLEGLGRVDRMAKGVGRRGEPPVHRAGGESWAELARLALAVAGVRVLPAIV